MTDSQFRLQHATASVAVKGEDAVSIQPLTERPQYPQSKVYIVCDGHNGAQAANFASASFHRLLCTRLPLKCPDLSSQTRGVQTFAAQVRRAMCEAFVATDNAWLELGCRSGTAMTVVLVIGGLVTAANIGDSAAVLATGCWQLELTSSHRLQDNLQEQSRLQQTPGCRVASVATHMAGPAPPGEQGLGPLRLWPGGLAMSRAIGDIQAGEHLVPIPHVKQVLLEGQNAQGCRIILGSDGLWDAMSFGHAISLGRYKSASFTAAELARVAACRQRTRDDTSVVVVDVWPVQPKPAPLLAAQGSVGFVAQLFACLRAGKHEPEHGKHGVVPGEVDLAPTRPGHVSVFEEVDGLYAYPELRNMLVRNLHRPVLGSSNRGMSDRCLREFAEAARRQNSKEQQEPEPCEDWMSDPGCLSQGSTSHVVDDVVFASMS